MSSAAAVRPPTYTVAGIEHCLVLDGIPLDRFLIEAKVPRSTWTTWRAGRARPRPGRWAAVTAAFDTLVADATPAPAEVEPEAAAPVVLTGSSAPTGAPPSFVPVATAVPVVEAPTEPTRAGVLAAIERYRAVEGLPDENPDDDDPDHDPREQAGLALERLAPVLAHRPAATVGDLAVKAELAAALGGTDRWQYEHMVLAHAHLVRAIIDDARHLGQAGADPAAGLGDVEVAAERVAALARREWAALGRTMQTDERRSAQHSKRADIADRAANRFLLRLNRRLRASCRALARQPAATSGALAAKARVVLAVENATESDPWWVALRDAVVREAAALDRAMPDLQAPSPPGSGHHIAHLTADWLQAGAAQRRTGEDSDVIPGGHPDFRAAVDRMCQAAEINRAVLRRIVGLRSLSPDVLALKVAVVAEDLGGVAGVERYMAHPGDDIFGDVELAVALSIVRDLAAAHEGAVRRLLDAIAAGAAAARTVEALAEPGNAQRRAA